MDLQCHSRMVKTVKAKSKRLVNDKSLLRCFMWITEQSESKIIILAKILISIIRGLLPLTEFCSSEVHVLSFLSGRPGYHMCPPSDRAQTPDAVLSMCALV